MIQCLEMCPYQGTCCYLLENKGMHCYNGNPPTGGLNLTEDIAYKKRLCALLIDGGGAALRYTISRIVLKIKLQNVDVQTRCQLCVNDKNLLYTAGLILPSLDELTQTDCYMVWTKALQQSPLTSGTAQDMKDMIYNYLVSEGLDIQLKNNKQRVQELNNEKQLLSKEQWDILYPRFNATIDLESFDITLQCFVILNVFQFKPTSGIRSQAPPAGDVDVGDDILRLRRWRGKLTPSSSSVIDNSTFKTAWTEIRDVLLRLKPGQELSDKIQHLHDCQVDPGNAAKNDQLIADWIKHDTRLGNVASDMSQIQEYLTVTRKAVKRKGKRTATSAKAVKKHVTEAKENTSKDNENSGTTRDSIGSDVQCSAGQSSEDNRPKMMQATVKAWRKENIYKTKGVAATQEKILSQDCVCVVGVPGAGKSTAIQHAALCLEKKGYIIYVINVSTEFMNYFDEDKKQVYILDDVLGIYSLDQGKVKLWDENNNDIRRVIGTKTKLLVSIRTQLYNQAVKGNNFIFLDKFSCIDFSDKTYRLDGTDMIGMLTHDLTVQGVDKVDGLIRQICYPSWYTEKEVQNMTEERRQRIMSRYTEEFREFSHCFPLLCKVFCSEELVRHDPWEFFTNPFQALTQIFNKIKSDNKLQFCSLVLCTVFDGKLTEDMFSIDCEDNNECGVNLRNVIMKAFHLEGHLLEIKAALNSLDGVYVTRVENTYTMSHRVFHDVVTYLFNDTDPSFVLKYGTRELIRDRIRLNQTQPIDDLYMIIINDDNNIDRLAHRLFTDLKSDTWSGAEFIAENVNIGDDRLISRLKSKLSDREQTDKTMINDLFRQCMWTVRVNRDTFKHGDVPQYNLIECCLQETDVDIVNVDIYGVYYPIHISVMAGSLQLIQFLLRHGADKRRVDSHGLSVLHWVCSDSKNRLDIIKLLTQHGDLSVVDFITSNRRDILEELERHSDNLQLEEVLSGRSIKVLTTDKHKMKDYVEHSEGIIQLVRRVHDNILTYVGRGGRNILHYSVDNYIVTEYLFNCKCLQKDINRCDEDNKTPYWYVVNNKKAVLYGRIKDVVIEDKQDIVKLYEKHGAVYDSSDILSDRNDDSCEKDILSDSSDDRSEEDILSDSSDDRSEEDILSDSSDDSS